MVFNSGSILRTLEISLVKSSTWLNWTRCENSCCLSASKDCKWRPITCSLRIEVMASSVSLSRHSEQRLSSFEKSVSAKIRYEGSYPVTQAYLHLKSEMLLRKLVCNIVLSPPRTLPKTICRSWEHSSHAQFAQKHSDSPRSQSCGPHLSEAKPRDTVSLSSNQTFFTKPGPMQIATKTTAFL